MRVKERDVRDTKIKSRKPKELGEKIQIHNSIYTQRSYKIYISRLYNNISRYIERHAYGYVNA